MIGALVAVLALVLGVGAAVLYGRGCEDGPCRGEEAYTLSDRAMLNEAGVCAVVEQSGMYRYTYRTTLLGEHRRYLTAEVVPQRTSVRLTAGCGQEAPVVADSLAVSAAWKSRLRGLEWARDSLGADIASMADDPQILTQEHDDVAATLLVPPAGHRVELTFTPAARAGLSEPVAFGDVVVNVTRTVDGRTRAEAARVVKVKLYPHTGVSSIPVVPGGP